VDWHVTKSAYYLHNKLTDNGRLVSSPAMLEVAIPFRIGFLSLFATSDCLGSLTYGFGANYKLEAFSTANTDTFRTYVMGGIRFIDAKTWSAISGEKWGSTLPIVGLRNDVVLWRINRVSNLEFNAFWNPVQSSFALFYVHY